MEEENQETASCTRIAEALELTSIQVRKDLAMTGAVGRPKIGFEVRPLITAIENFLGWNNTKEAFLIGAGDLGSALLKYEGFSECGLNILAGFDVDVEKIGTDIAGKRIFPLEKLQDLAQRMHILIGVLTVPGGAAQDTADLMVEAGMRAIWNFTPAKLRVPSSVVVEDIRLSASLAVLTQKLANVLSNHFNPSPVPIQKE